MKSLGGIDRDLILQVLVNLAFADEVNTIPLALDLVGQCFGNGDVELAVHPLERNTLAHNLNAMTLSCSVRLAWFTTRAVSPLPCPGMLSYITGVVSSSLVMP